MSQDYELDPELYGLVLERRSGHLRFPPLYALTIRERQQVVNAWDRRRSGQQWTGQERRSA